MGFGMLAPVSASMTILASVPATIIIIEFSHFLGTAHQFSELSSLSNLRFKVANFAAFPFDEAHIHKCLYVSD